VIGKIARSFWYVRSDIHIDQLADELEDMDSLEAIGVVDSEDRVSGIILRKEFSQLLSQRYGRDIYKNKPVSILAQNVRTIDFKRNIYSLSEELSSDLSTPQTTYYVLTSEGRFFAGIFSTRDLNIYLAGIMQKDMTLAKKVQSCIVRDFEFVQKGRTEILGSTRMAKGIGGDFYSVFEYVPGRCLVNISDVSGKGMPASLVSVLLGGMFSLYDFTKGIPPFIMQLNSYLLRSFNGERFVTSSFLDLDSQTGEMSVFDCGHSYVFIVRGGSVLRVKTKGNIIPLGIDERCSPEPTTLSLKSGDILVLCTDGFDEQRDPSGIEFGLSRFFKVVMKYKSQGLVAVKNALFREIDLFRKDQTQSDDMTLIMVSYQ
jgi:serine phosphatase RsbU (regulator of sigma subunit)